MKKLTTKKIFYGFLIMLVISLGYVGVISAGSPDQPWWYMEQAENMGEPFSTPYNETELTYSSDGRQAFFMSNRPGGYGGMDIWMIEYKDGKWQDAVNLGPGVNHATSDNEPQISRDGKTLYYTPYDSPTGLGSGDVHISRLVDGVWQPAINWNDVPGLPPINQEGEDHCPIFANENLIYFSSERPGGYGVSDIWKVEKVKGEWQEPVNLGPNINSPYRDHLHWTGLSRDGNSLLIVSDRPDRGSFGGSDMWISTKDKDGNWGPVENLGPLVNTPYSEICWTFDPTGEVFHGSTSKPGGLGGSDFYWIYTRNIPLLKDFHGKASMP